MRRLPDFPRGEKVQFTLDGRAMEGYTGESLAAAILASGRTALSRSLRFHRPRSMFCSTGECGWCAVEVDGLPNVPACLLSCREGLTVRSQNAWPSTEFDLFGLLDLASPFLPNTFYHHRLLRPKFLRQFYLRVLRRFTGAGRLPGRSNPKAQGRDDFVLFKENVSMETDIAVVGGGPAGLSAATAAAEYGARVVLVDDGDAKPEISNLPFSNLTYWPRALCVGAYGRGVLGIVTPTRLVTLNAGQIILAPGALDALPLFVNNDLPGVMSARLVERLIEQEGIAPGTRAVVWGAASERLVTLLGRAGISVAHHLRESEAIVAAKGAGRVQAAIVRRPDGEAQIVRCDLIVIAALQPRNELLVQAGGEVRWEEAAGGFVAVRDRQMQTSVPGLYIVGRAAGPCDEARCAAEGRLAGLSAAQRAGFGEATGEIEGRQNEIAEMPRPAAFRFPADSLDSAGHVCFCEDVREREIRGERQRGYSHPELMKRRTGVLTGPCQGKFCLANFMRLIGPNGRAPTARPPAKPVRLGDLVLGRD